MNSATTTAAPAATSSPGAEKTGFRIALGLCVVVAGMMAYLWTQHRTYWHSADRRDLTNISMAATDPGMLVAMLLKDSALRTGGEVRLVEESGHISLVVSKATAESCRMIVAEGFVPVPMTKKILSIDGIQQEIPGNPDEMCGQGGPDAILHTLAWRLNG